METKFGEAYVRDNSGGHFWNIDETNKGFVFPAYLCTINQNAMPVNKDAMARYRIIDRMLADPQKDYTTKDIEKAVARECPRVTTRMIQKDIKALEEAPFNKKMLRGQGGRGTVRYEDQSTPLFFQELTEDEEEILREALESLGQFEGLENFKWLENLQKRLDMPRKKKVRPAISFARNDVLQIPENLLGQIYSAIARRKVIRFGYRRFQDAGQPFKQVTVYPYQLRQSNNRWFLLCNPVGNDEFPFDPDTIYNYALDRMDGKVEYVEEMPYIDTSVNIDARFNEIIGVTYKKGEKIRDIYFAVKSEAVNYVQTKFIHSSQDEVNPIVEKEFKEKYPSLRDCKFFVISCRPNQELLAMFASYRENLIVVEPADIRAEMKQIIQQSLKNYQVL